jgi:hypothetical protein
LPLSVLLVPSVELVDAMVEVDDVVASVLSLPLLLSLPGSFCVDVGATVVDVVELVDVVALVDVVELDVVELEDEEDVEVSFLLSAATETAPDSTMRKAATAAPHRVECPCAIPVLRSSCPPGPGAIGTGRGDRESILMIATNVSRSVR